MKMKTMNKIMVLVAMVMVSLSVFCGGREQ